MPWLAHGWFNDEIIYCQAQQAAQSRQGYHGSHRPQGPVTPKLSWAYHNYTSMTHFLRHVSTVYSNLTALYSIGQSVQGIYLQIKDKFKKYKLPLEIDKKY